MAAPTPNTIILKNNQNSLQVEHPAGGAIKPGHLVALNSSGAVVVHPVAGGSEPAKMFAMEDDAQGRGIDDDYDATTYNNVRCMICAPGTEVYAWIATGQSIAIGDALESAGNGQLREHIPQTGTQTSPATGGRTGQIVARSLQTIDSTSPVGVTRIQVRVV
jgi:hypothetical protein